jgi:hypothetical protein
MRCGYSNFLKEKLIGISLEDTKTIIRDPVGRQTLMNELADNTIQYTPEELIAIAQIEYDWSEKVKEMHVPPGKQLELIHKLVVEGSNFVK